MTGPPVSRGDAKPAPERRPDVKGYIARPRCEPLHTGLGAVLRGQCSFYNAPVLPEDHRADPPVYELAELKLSQGRTKALGQLWGCLGAADPS